MIPQSEKNEHTATPASKQCGRGQHLSNKELSVNTLLQIAHRCKHYLLHDGNPLLRPLKILQIKETEKENSFKVIIHQL